MENKTLEIKAALQIRKPVNEVFEAIVDPIKMSNYFISKSSGRMEEGKQIKWQFPEFDMEFPIRIGKIESNKYVSFYWDMDGIELLVEMTLTPKENNSTVVTITEKSRNNDEAGIKWLMGNTEGWANFLACLKAYLEYGINLRKGAFDFMSNKGLSDDLNNCYENLTRSVGVISLAQAIADLHRDSSLAKVPGQLPGVVSGDTTLQAGSKLKLPVRSLAHSVPSLKLPIGQILHDQSFNTRLSQLPCHYAQDDKTSSV